MTDIRHIQHGDLVILSTGEEAIANGIIDYDKETKRYRIEYRKPVLGWPNEVKQWSWWYNEDGTFATSDLDDNVTKYTNIVKVVHNGSIQTED